MTNPTTTPPGWYDDGTGNSTQRYWDGAQWTDAPAQPAPVAAVPIAAPAAAAAPAVAPDGSAPVATGVVATPAAKERNTLAIVALAVAVVGFILAVIPGALIVGWVALPIAFVLAIVALFLKGKGKGLAITALIVAIVGTIVGFIVFFAVVASSFNNAFGGTESSVTQAVTPKATQAAAGDAAAKLGTREHPAALGSVVTGKEFTVKINSVNLNATAAVLAANEFNEAPAAGSAYALVNATVTYTGSKSGLAAEAQIAYVTAEGKVINSFDKIVMAPEPALGADELYKGANATGNLVLTIPADGKGLIRVTPGLFADDVFIATK